MSIPEFYEGLYPKVLDFFFATLREVPRFYKTHALKGPAQARYSNNRDKASSRSGDGRSRVPTVYTDGNKVGRLGLTRVQFRRIETWAVFLGFYIDDLHSPNPQRNRGSYSDFKKVGTLFFQVEHMDS